ncbi:MAG: hypothetical protein WCA00_16285 [Candidatus Acidiferrales bacterium]
MNRRDFLRATGVFSAGLAFAKPGRIFADDDAVVESWRAFDVTKRVEVLKLSETTRIWLPTALISETTFQKTLSKTFQPAGGTAKMIENKPDAPFWRLPNVSSVSYDVVAPEFPSVGHGAILAWTR